MNLTKHALTCYVSLFLLSSCLSYSHTGTNLPDEVKTIKVSYFENFSGNGPANIGQDFTQDLQDFYRQNTRLNVLSKGKADLEIEGEIVGYETSPLAPASSGTTEQFDRASKTLLTVTVKVHFTNSFAEDESFEKKFSYKEEFDSSKTLDQVEDGLLEIINLNIIQDIFNATVANW